MEKRTRNFMTDDIEVPDIAEKAVDDVTCMEYLNSYNRCLSRNGMKIRKCQEYMTKF